MKPEPRKLELLLWWLMTYGTESSKRRQYNHDWYLNSSFNYDCVDATRDGFVQPGSHDLLDLRLTQAGLDYLNKD